MATTREWMLGAAMLAATACTPGVHRYDSSAPRRASAVWADGALPVTVVNHNLAEMKVYIVRHGLIVARLGTVSGTSSETFWIRPMFFGTGDVTLVARPIGGYGSASTGMLLVGGGQTVTFTVEMNLNLSSATVR
jgi:hypothetical protein